MIPLVTKRSTVLGLPIGPRRTDWAQVGKLAAMGLGAVSTAAGGMGARVAGRKLKEKASEQAQTAKQTVAKVGKAAQKASNVAEMLPGGGGGERSGDGESLKKLRLIIKEAIDVGVPLETAYNQWTQFGDLPSIMGGPQNVEQESDEETRWTVKIGPSRRRWNARILEQVPDERIVWESTEGAEHRGVVTFHSLDTTLTRVHVEMEYFPHGAIEKIGNVFLAARRRTRKDLRLFKHYLELAGSETGAWRGEIHEDGESPEEEPEEEAPEEEALEDEPEDEDEEFEEEDLEEEPEDEDVEEEPARRRRGGPRRRPVTRRAGGRAA